nr:gamma-glutamyl cyclotransferase glik [Quercus suber]
MSSKVKPDALSIVNHVNGDRPACFDSPSFNMDNHEEPSFNRALAAGTTAQHVLPLVGTSADDRGLAALPAETYDVPSYSSSKASLEYYSRSEAERNTVLYLAYGSNLSNKTFIGNRGIRPLSAVNVQVPSLRLTFDLPGIPYVEPCFANSGRRDPENDPSSTYDSASVWNGKTGQNGYRKDRWHKGLIGVVYEVSLKDYAHIIATEGGGASYDDILVDCHPFASSDVTAPVPQDPTQPSFKAHTLFAPATPRDSLSCDSVGRYQRPDPSYAQASARYLKLLTDGAAERGLPYEYQHYLQSLHSYTITTRRQQAGKVLLVGLWLPVISFLFILGKIFAGPDGRTPPWLAKAMTTIFNRVWSSYDNVFKKTFGDGERTVGDIGVDPDEKGVPTPYFDDEKA